MVNVMKFIVRADDQNLCMVRDVDFARIMLCSVSKDFTISFMNL